jgi:ubiquinone/menaquinone biosynthesis C-methylase UbiE
MARLEAQSRLLYYPTPEVVTRLIASHFKAEKPVRLADPCCGTGEALRIFADTLGVPAETWGVELSYSRAQAAARTLDRVLPASFYHVTWSPKASACFCSKSAI